jgi:hypothetical protein
LQFFEIIGQTSGTDFGDLVEWLCENSLPNLALLVAAMKGQSMIKQVLQRFVGSVCKRMLSECLRFLFEFDDDNESVAACISCIPYSMATPDSLFREQFSKPYTDVSWKTALGLNSALMQAGAIGWAIGLCILYYKWMIIKRLMPSCEDATVSRWVLDGVCTAPTAPVRYWNLCLTCMKYCTDRDTLYRVVYHAVTLFYLPDTGASDVIRAASDLVDISLISPKVLRAVTSSSCYNGGLLKTFVSVGFYSSNRGHLNLMKHWFRKCNLDMLKILHRAGIWTDQELYECRQEMENLGFDPDIVVSEEHKVDVKAYVRQMTVVPLSLQDLSRLKVSYHLGLQPGRSGRIEALPVPGVIKKMLVFADLVGEDWDH